MIDHIPTQDNKALKWIFFLALACLVIFILTIPLPRIDGRLVGSDGTRYYTILLTLVFDHDFNMADENELLNLKSDIVPETGMVYNPFAIGTALLWMPFFILAHLVSLLLRGSGLNISVNGVSYLYESFVLTGTIIYGSIGFYLSYKVARRLFEVQPSLIATLATWLATQGIYYMIAEPSMSHALTIFTNALFLFVWYPPRPDRNRFQWAVLGLTVAITTLTRWQEGIIILVPVVELLWWVWKKNMSIKSAAQSFLLFFTTFLIGISPQLIMWNSIYGSPLLIPQGNDFMLWMSPKPIQTLISTRHGLFTWHPLFLISLFGLIPLWKKDRSLTILIGYLFLSQLYINSAASHWWADDAFGGRRFTGIIPYIIISLAALLHYFKASRWYKFITLFLFFLILWNALSFAQYRLGFVEKDAALTIKEMSVDRLLLPITIIQKILQYSG